MAVAVIGVIAVGAALAGMAAAWCRRLSTIGPRSIPTGSTCWSRRLQRAPYLQFRRDSRRSAQRSARVITPQIARGRR